MGAQPQDWKAKLRDWAPVTGLGRGTATTGLLTPRDCEHHYHHHHRHYYYYYCHYCYNDYCKNYS